MSDVGLDFPVWMMPLLTGMLFWPVLLVAAALLAGLALAVRGWRRRGLFALACVALLPCVAVLVMEIASVLHAASARRAYARTHETLAAPRQIGGLSLPAGTVVEWTDARHEKVVSVELPGATPLLGTVLTGTLEDVADRWWSGTLASDATLFGWPCGAGHVWLSHQGRPLRCTLAADHAADGLAIPAGSEVALADTGRVRDLRLPEHRTMELPSIGASLPGGGSLFLRPDGAVERAYVPEPGILRVGDVGLRFEIRWLYDEARPRSERAATGLRGDLAEDSFIDGVAAPAGSLITLDLATRTARVAPPR